MVVATSNRLLSLLAGAVLLMLVFITLKSCSGDRTDPVFMGRVPEMPAPDADTPADTIKTLTANVAAMTTEVEALRQDNTGLRRENQQLLRNRTQIEENVATRLRRELLAREKDAANRVRIDSGVLSSLTTRVDALAASLDDTRAKGLASDIPVGLGLVGPGDAPADAIVWIEPLDALETDGEGGFPVRATRSSGGLLNSARSGTALVVDGIDLQPSPVYTVPRNATLIGSTAMTALVGRIPIPRSGPRPDALQGHHRR